MKKLIILLSVIICMMSMAIVSCKKKDQESPVPEPLPCGGTLTPSFTDSRDNKTYKAVILFGQIWMAENLNYSGSLSEGSSSCYSNSQDSCNKYGRLYTGNAAKVACPEGWHLPTDEEWRLLEHNLGMTNADTSLLGLMYSRGVQQAIGWKLQEVGNAGFDAMLLGTSTTFWLSDSWPGNPGSQYMRRFVEGDSSCYRAYNINPAAYSACVRCIKD